MPSIVRFSVRCTRTINHSCTHAPLLSRYHRPGTRIERDHVNDGLRPCGSGKLQTQSQNGCRLDMSGCLACDKHWSNHHVRATILTTSMCIWTCMTDFPALDICFAHKRGADAPPRCAEPPRNCVRRHSCREQPAAPYARVFHRKPASNQVAHA